MDLDFVSDLSKQLLNVGPELLLGLGAIALGYALQLIPTFPNKWIPAVCIFSPAIVYPFLAECGKCPYDVRYPFVRFVLIGLLIGVAAWALHNQVLKRLIDDRFP